MSFRDRFYTPQVARAMTSPSGIVAGGAGAAIGVLVGLGPIGAVIGAIIAWVARVGIAIPRRQRAPSTRIDPFSLGDRWNRLVRDAQQAQHSFDRALRGTPPGPLRDRLDVIRAHLGTTGTRSRAPSIRPGPGTRTAAALTPRTLPSEAP